MKTSLAPRALWEGMFVVPGLVPRGFWDDHPDPAPAPGQSFVSGQYSCQEHKQREELAGHKVLREQQEQGLINYFN